MISEIDKLIDQISTSVEEFTFPQLSSDVNSVVQSSRLVGRSWGHRPFEGESDVYYKDFKTPPRGAFFEGNFGLAGEWHHYDDITVEKHIFSLSRSKTTMSQAKLYSNRCVSRVSEFKTKLLSLIAIQHANHPDDYCHHLSHDVKNIKVITSQETLDALLGKRTYRSTTASMRFPAHFHILAQFGRINLGLNAHSKLVDIARHFRSHVELTSSLKPSTTLPSRPSETIIPVSNIAGEPMTDAPLVFVAYQHKDSQWLQQLENHLGALIHAGKIEFFDDRKILAGSEWDPVIREKLNSAKVIVPLISSNFLGSKYVQTIELPSAINRHRSGSATVIPVLLDHCDWPGLEHNGFALAQINFLPKDDNNDLKSISELRGPKRSQAFAQIAKRIRDCVNEASHPKLEIQTQYVSYETLLQHADGNSEKVSRMLSTFKTVESKGHRAGFHEELLKAGILTGKLEDFQLPWKTKRMLLESKGSTVVYVYDLDRKEKVYFTTAGVAPLILMKRPAQENLAVVR